MNQIEFQGLTGPLSEVLMSAFIVTVVCKIWCSIEDGKLEEKVAKRSPEECLYCLTLLSSTTNDKLSTISQ